MDIVVEWERIQYSAKHAKCIINLGWYELMLRLCFSPWDFLSHDPWSLPKGLSHLFSHLPFSAPILNYSLKIVVCLRSDMGRARSYQIVAEMCYRSPWISCNPITIFPTNGPTLGKSPSNGNSQMLFRVCTLSLHWSTRPCVRRTLASPTVDLFIPNQLDVFICLRSGAKCLRSSDLVLRVLENCLH